MQTPQENAQIDALLQMRKSVLDSIASVVEIHGEDPDINAIISASLKLVVVDIDEIIPNFKSVLISLLMQT